MALSRIVRASLCRRQSVVAEGDRSAILERHARLIHLAGFGTAEHTVDHRQQPVCPQSQVRRIEPRSAGDISASYKDRIADHPDIGLTLLESRQHLAEASPLIWPLAHGRPVRCPTQAIET